jgi:hypothetical protein
MIGSNRSTHSDPGWARSSSPDNSPKRTYDPEARYLDLGAGFYESRISNQHREHDLIRQLERLAGQKVAPQPRPDQPAA